MQPVVFPSRVDWWVAAVIVVLASISAVVAFVVTHRGGLSGFLVAVPVVLVGAGLPLWILCSTRYAFEDGDLRIASGPFRWRVSIRDIQKITATRNPLSSPALSLDRLRLDYASGRWIMISPRDKPAFIAELQRRQAAAQDAA